MKHVPAKTLPKLCADAAYLVSVGVYSLFELRGSVASYLLTTPTPEFYLLDTEGAVVIADVTSALASKGEAIWLLLEDSVFA